MAKVDCLGADPRPHAPGFALPDDACDCHAHIFGPTDRYPLVAGRGYTPPDAPLDDYRQMLGALGLTRAVIVQPSIYGTDNRATLDAVAACGGAFRAVVVVDAGVGDAELEAMHAVGARGVRLNLLSPGGPGEQALEAVAARVAPLGWHLQLLVDATTFPNLRRRVERLPTEVVFDHMGHLNAAKGPEHAGFQAMLGLVRDGRAWVKLSAAYRLSACTAPTWADTIPVAEAVVATDPGRCVWGSDWPHPGLRQSMPNDGDLLSLLARWAPDAAQRHRILVDNPAQLYGFA